MSYMNPRPIIYECNDGSLIIEWIKKGKRFGISLEKDLTESGWFFAGLNECASEEFSEQMTKYLRNFFEE